LGPGGLKKERAGFEVRDVHPTHFGRICPIETPEGQNAGLIGSLTVYSKINEYGFIETPLMKVDERHLKISEIKLMDAHEEDGYIIASPDVRIEGDFISDEKVPVKFVRDDKHEFSILTSEQIDYIRVSPRQMISVATSLIPFLEHDDANRALMGTNMQRQSVPLILPEGPLVGSEMEYRTALDSGVVVVAKEAGTVRSIKGVRAKDGHMVYEIEIMTDPKPGRRVVNVKTSDKEFLRKGNRKVCYETIIWPETGEIIIEKGEAFSLNILKKVKRLGMKSISVYNAKIDVYRLEKFGKSNQDTCINQRPIVKLGQHIEKGEIIADGHCVDNGELAL
jgi:DNA-directed RNA polymerase subunit beta